MTLLGELRAATGGEVKEADYRGVDPNRGRDASLAWRLRQPVVPAAKAVFRSIGWVTADLRCAPDYLVVGGKRTGSTTLARNLAASEDVLPLVPEREDRKGMYYFDAHFDRGERWYRSHFPLERTRDAARRRQGRAVVVGEASPYYLHHPHAPERAARFARHARIVAVLRDPVDRAASHYRERVRQGIEHLESFEEALEAEPERLAGEWERMLDDPSYVSLAHLNHGYLAQSHYADAVERWIDAFGRDQVLVLRSEDLFAAPEATLGVVRRFLGLAEIDLGEAQHFNRLPGSAIDTHLDERIRRAVAPDQQRVAQWIHHAE